MGFTKISEETGNSFCNLLEYAANNDVEAFKRSIELDLSCVDEPGPWYVRKMGSKHITSEERTPLMVAATYGSLDVLKLLVALPEVDLNRLCGRDKWTALHCAAFGCSVNAYHVIKLLLSAGADPNVMDSTGRRPADVIVVPPKLPGGKAAIEDLLVNNSFDGPVADCNLRVSISTSNASSPVLSSSSESRSPFSPSYSPKQLPATNTTISEKKQYPVDPSLPDIRNSIYSTDEFRMFSFKVRPCSRAYSHDWTECPFVHPGENARRRDPRKFHYSCVPCPDFRKGACRRGDMCEYAHGVFECWLHPAQYRTRLCKDGTSCARQVCFFAHTQEELRPLYVSTGSGVPSPRSSASTPSFMDMASALSIFPGSPTSQSVMSPNGMSHPSPAWPLPNVPTLHLPGSNLQSSRLRSSLSARDIPPEDLNLLHDYETQQLVMNDLARFQNSGINRPKAAALTPSNLEEFFSAEMGSSSPRFCDAAGFGAFSPSHKSAVFNQFQQQQQKQNINANLVFSPRNLENPLLQGPFSSPRSVDQSSLLSAIAQRERRSLSSRELGSHHHGPVTAAWLSPNNNNGKAEWSSFEMKKNDDGVEGGEPDLSWVQSLVKESPPEMDKDKQPASGECLNNHTTNSQTDSVLGAWLEQMRLDQLVV
ncbi:zinc finger CCCH domain-containing protein 30 [Striga asiatica]|uniref:Zinc finger CCCH domain-containing protein 30 n=1 Tax=Striga asiatica TaxID=4170 RepID=A0A5A7P4C0_STRAF|nr:zinc finger CCCH domain-containing protein 30 [Striga asiatica]